LSKAPKIEPWTDVAARLAQHELAAFKALDKGIANPSQQKLVLDTIIEKLAGYYDLSFRPGPDGGRIGDFCEGKRWVGAAIVRAIKLPMKTQG